MAPAAKMVGPPAANSRTGRLSEGTLVEASVVARVLGIRLLTVDAIVVLSPAAPARATPVAGPAPPASRPAGRGLARAVRSIEEGAQLLEEARRQRGVY
jgi:hypothetical protein